MTDTQEREPSAGLDEAWEVVTQMAGGANVGPRFLSLARLVVSLDKRLAEAFEVTREAAEYADRDHAALARALDRIRALEGVVSSITHGMEDADDAPRHLSARVKTLFARGFERVNDPSQSSTRTPGIGADMEQADGEREKLLIDAIVQAQAFAFNEGFTLGREYTHHSEDGKSWTERALAAAALRPLAQKDGEQEEGGFFDMARRELARAREMHPGFQNSLHEGYAVLLEEVEEFWDEVKLKASKRDPSRTLKELIQVAAMAGRVAEDCGLLPAPVQSADDAVLRVMEPAPAPSELDEDVVERVEAWIADNWIFIGQRISAYHDFARSLLTECRLSPVPISQPTEAQRELVRASLRRAFGTATTPDWLEAEADRLLSELFPAKGEKP